MISIHNPIGPTLALHASNSIIEHLLEPVCCGFAVHWMFATLNIAFGVLYNLNWFWYPSVGA